MVAKSLFCPNDALAGIKRQTAGTVRRSRGAFGLIPRGSALNADIRYRPIGKLAALQPNFIPP